LADDDLCGKTRDRVCPNGWYDRAGKPIRLPTTISMPEPDRCLVHGEIRDYHGRDSEPTDIAVVVEVADTSLREDRDMARVNSAGGVPVCVVVNLVARQVEVHSVPSPNGCQSREVLMPGPQVPVLDGTFEIGQIAVPDIMP
jgi:Putative restriction endonuclease